MMTISTSLSTIIVFVSFLNNKKTARNSLEVVKKDVSIVIMVLASVRLKDGEKYCVTCLNPAPLPN